MQTATAEQKIQIGNYKDIYTQLGGNKFVVMTGSKIKYYGYNDNGYVYLMVELSKNQSRAKYLKIQLNWKDLYDLEFSRIKRTLTPLAKELNIKVFDEEQVIVTKMDDVYGEDLQGMFSQVTGLSTRLF